MVPAGDFLDPERVTQVLGGELPNFLQHRVTPVAGVGEVVQVTLEGEHPLEQRAFLCKLVLKAAAADSLEKGETVGRQRRRVGQREYRWMTFRQPGEPPHDIGMVKGEPEK